MIYRAARRGTRLRDLNHAETREASRTRDINEGIGERIVYRRRVSRQLSVAAVAEDHLIKSFAIGNPRISPGIYY